MCMCVYVCGYMSACRYVYVWGGGLYTEGIHDVITMGDLQHSV